MSDPVDVLMGIQLGGGTDINRALAYCQTLITRPTDTIFVLITDLYEGGDRDEMLKRAAAIVGLGRADGHAARARRLRRALVRRGRIAAALAGWACRASPARPIAFRI